MSNTYCHWREEDVVRFVLGQMTGPESSLFSGHLPDCETCAAVCKQWESLLQENTSEPGPSPELKDRLLASIAAEHRKAERSGWARRFWRKPFYPAASFGLMLILLVAATVYSPAPVQQDRGERESWQGGKIVNDPRTVLHLAVTTPPNQAKGYVWVNDDSEEILFLAEGLAPLREKDYQVWFIIRNNRLKAGVLQWNGQISHLYFHGGTIHQVEDIAVSIEPKGGSFIPTGPDTFYVKLRER
ncbi:anti-sigma factor domain-containing protein [Brevibacillus fulvus]|uniref:Anti-sigma-K factor RskA n=1 Tax=Brevibacillus fulvus TaxID=1125967 RepID=A0A938Y1I7_9BACL|nr:anti-sigma-K factor RskA [Brevibacillus fulvus]